MSSTTAPLNDPSLISLSEEITRLDYEITPAMEPLVSLLKKMAQVAPAAVRNKHKLYSIILRAREVCNHIMAIGMGPESVGLETLSKSYNLTDSLEEQLLLTVEILVAEQGPLSPEFCSSWSETRARLVAIMYGLYKSPFTFDQSGLERELENSTFFDDCSWFSYLLHGGIEKEFGLGVSPPEAIASVKETLEYLEWEIKHGHLDEKKRENAINSATRLYESISALGLKEEGGSEPLVRRAEPELTPAGQDAFIKEWLKEVERNILNSTSTESLGSEFFALKLGASPQPTESQKPEEQELAISTLRSTASSGVAHTEKRPVSLIPPSPPDEFSQRPKSFKTGSSTDTQVKSDGKPQFFLKFSNRVQKEKMFVGISEEPLNRKANEDWVATIRVNGAEYAAGPMKTKAAAKEAAAEKALRGLGWL